MTSAADLLHVQRMLALSNAAKHLLGEWGTEWLATGNPELPGIAAPQDLVARRNYQPVVDLMYRMERSPLQLAAERDRAYKHKLARLGRAMRTHYPPPNTGPGSGPR